MKMKKLYKLSALALALALAAVFVVQTNAQVSDVQLEITGGAINCTNGDFTYASTGVSFTDQVLDTADASAIFECVDLKPATTNYTVTMGNSITNAWSATPTIIPDANVTFTAGTATEDCAGTITTANGTLDGSVVVMSKSDTTDLCTYSVDPDLDITVPGQATVGVYTGDIAITLPS